MKSALALIGWIALCYAAAAAGAVFTTGNWYAILNKPTWSPPGWLFGPVWTLLYTMMGVSAWMVWGQGRGDASPEQGAAATPERGAAATPERGTGARRRLARTAASPIRTFMIQLALNAVWTPLFFGARQIGLAFIEIIVLWCAILATIIAFRRVSTTAAWLLVPYLLWVTFASVLNGALWWMN
jgi:tryptophan-rich sensory protein